MVEGIERILLLLRRFPHSATDHSSSVVNVNVETTSAAHCSYLNLVKPTQQKMICYMRCVNAFFIDITNIFVI